MKHTDLSGIFPAFPTPMKADGTLDVDALSGLIEFLLSNGASGLVPVGGTGEFTALSQEIRVQVVEHTVALAAGRVPVVPGVLSPGYAEAVDTGRAFTRAGADGLLLITPFYVTASQQGVRSYFQSYRGDVDLPLLLYDVPSRTHVVVEPETIARMADEGSIVGMKACNVDTDHFNRTAALVADRIAILCGEDTLFPVHMMLGARGGVLATAALLPRFWVRIYEAAREGRFADAIADQRRLLPLFNAVFAEPNPGPLKEIMTMTGLDMGTVLRPLCAPSERTVGQLRQVVADLRAVDVL